MPDPIKILIGFRASIFSQTILMAAAIGTESNAPVIPHIQPKKTNDSKITTGLRLRLSPIIFGSSTLPIVIWIKRSMTAVKIGISIHDPASGLDG